MHPMSALVERNAWATEKLLDFCMEQRPEVVTASAGADVYGGIDALFTHIVSAECGYLPIITGERREDRLGDQQPMALADLVEPAKWAAERWPGALDFDRDPEAVYISQRRRGPTPMSDWLPLLQAVQHSDDHRNQVATVLSRHGVVPPELDLWAFGEAVGFERLDANPGRAARRDAVLKRAFKHHAWATERLIDRCMELSREQLALTAPGAYGSILDTFDHMISADRSYLSRLSGTGRKPALNAGALPPLRDEFTRTAEGWLAFLDSHPDFDAPVDMRDGTRVGSWVIVAQAIHHGNDHRTHIGTTMMHNGLPIPELDPASYSEAVTAPAGS